MFLIINLWSVLKLSYVYLNFTCALFSLFYSSSFYYFFNYIQAVFTIYQMNKLGSWISLPKFAQPNKTIKGVCASVFLNNKFSKKCILFIKSNILWVFSLNHVGLMTFLLLFFQFLNISAPTLNESLRRASICQRLQKETSIC